MSDKIHPDPAPLRRLSYAEFLDARLNLREAGVPPRVASALANVGVISLADLRACAWDGPTGLRQQLSRSRHVGASTLKEIERWRLADPDTERPKPRAVITWESRAKPQRHGGR